MFVLRFEREAGTPGVMFEMPNVFTVNTESLNVNSVRHPGELSGV